MKPLSRREFFRASALVALGAVAAACSKKKISTGKAPTTLAQLTKGHPQTLQMNTAGFEVLSGKPDRLVFNLIDPSNGSAVTTPTAKIWIAKDQQSPALGPLVATYKDEGLPADKGFYEVPITIASDGTWLAVAEVVRAGSSAADFTGAQFQVGVQNAMPKTGAKAVAVPTPTYSDHRGVNPICTAKPICSMHALSLDAALKNAKPTVLIIATPQFCQSALCGPEVDVVQSVAKEFAGRVNYVHVEVYRDDKPDTIQRAILSPAAAQWHLDQEPVIYYIDTAGVIKSRTIGPADKSEVRVATNTLLG